jgi:CRP-like cAMP-binding protein
MPITGQESKLINPNSFRNVILGNLDAQTITRLHLRPLKLELRHALEEPGEPVDHVFFLESGIASVTVRFRDGFEVEAGMYGHDSLSGISAFMGTRGSLNASYMQIAGHGHSCSIERAAAEFQLGGRFHSLALRAVQAQFVQSMQSAGCNAHHEIEPRLARWILLCADRTEANSFALSHEFVATMLGARRTSVSIAAGNLKKRGLIRYTRSNIHIADRPGLEATACECYGVLREYLRNFNQYDSGLVEPAA